MGRPKALIQVRGVPLWRDRAELLRGLGPLELMISAPADLPIEAGPWTLVRDGAPGLGPLAGIEAALKAMSAERLLVLAVDMPDMTAEFLAGMVRADGSTGVVPEDDGLYQGLAAVYPRSILALVREILAGGDRSLQFLVKRAVEGGLVRSRSVAERERPLFRNVNRPDDLRR